MISDEAAKKIRDDNNFKEFRDHILDEIDSLNSVEGMIELSNEDAGELSRINALTILKLRKILSPFIDFAQKKEPSANDIQKRKQRFGLA